MTITEKDIFDYINFKDTLEREKCEYIENNIEKYTHLIELYNESFRTLSDPLNSDIEKRFGDFFPFETRILLFPIDLQKSADKIVRLAADSVQGRKTFKAVSFADKESKYIVRALFFEDKTELFVLSVENRPLENFKVITKPSLKEYTFKDNTHSILTDEKVIEQVEIIYN
jgi:hypothetical protein